MRASRRSSPTPSSGSSSRRAGLGIPVVFHDECLHGHAAVDGTSFPQPIGLGATFDVDLVERLYAMTAAEARSRGVHQALTPVVDVAREPRWGRVEETFGEDTHLCARMGVAAVRGFQGDATFKDKTRVMATLKHFVAHGQPEAGQNCAPANVSMRELREVFLPPFKAAIQEAGAISVMPSYNEVDGVPSHANRWLLRDVLRKEWGFTGFTVSDYYAIWELSDRPDTHGHHVAADKRDAAVLAVKAGVNSELPEPDCYLHLVELVRVRRAEGVGARRSRRADAPLEVQDGIVRRSVRRSRRRRPPRWLGAESGAGARGGARCHHAAQERRQPAAARRVEAQDRSPSSGRTPTAAARRLQRRAEAHGLRARRHQGTARRQREGALQRRLQDHHRRLVDDRRGRRQRSRTKTAA